MGNKMIAVKFRGQKLDIELDSPWGDPALLFKGTSRGVCGRCKKKAGLRWALATRIAVVGVYNWKSEAPLSEWYRVRVQAALRRAMFYKRPLCFDCFPFGIPTEL